MIEQQVTESLTRLSNNLGVSHEKLWEWGLLQVKAQITKSIFLLLMIFLMWFMLYKIVRLIIFKWDMLGGETTGFLVTCGIIIVSISVAVLPDLFSRLMQYIINPEYSAFKIIINELSKS